MAAPATDEEIAAWLVDEMTPIRTSPWVDSLIARIETLRAEIKDAHNALDAFNAPTISDRFKTKFSLVGRINAALAKK